MNSTRVQFSIRFVNPLMLFNFCVAVMHAYGGLLYFFFILYFCNLMYHSVSMVSVEKGLVGLGRIMSVVRFAKTEQL